MDHLIDPLDQSNENEHSDPGHQDSARAIDVRAVRRAMRLTQREFAGWFGFSIATLRHWERGNRRPVGAALVLLHVIRENPRVVRQAVRKARMWLAAIEPLRSRRAPPGYGLRQPRRWPRRR